MPGVTELQNLVSYFGPDFGGKMTARYVSPKSSTSSDDFVNPLEYAMRRGQGHGEGATLANVYTANISGFNLRAIGYYEPGSTQSRITCSSVSDDGIIMLKSEDVDNVYYFTIHNYSPFSNTDFNSMLHVVPYTGATYRTTALFAQVRFVMRFKYQDDTSSGNSLTMSTRRSSSSSAKRKTNNVYVAIEEVSR